MSDQRTWGKGVLIAHGVWALLNFSLCLLLVLAGGFILFMVSQQRLARQRESARAAENEASAFREALNLLDEDTRRRILQQNHAAEPPPTRSPDYER